MQWGKVEWWALLFLFASPSSACLPNKKDAYINLSHYVLLLCESRWCFELRSCFLIVVVQNAKWANYVDSMDNVYDLFPRQMILGTEIRLPFHISYVAEWKAPTHRAFAYLEKTSAWKKFFLHELEKPHLRLTLNVHIRYVYCVLCLCRYLRYSSSAFFPD